ncbi:kinesin-like protein KIF19 [Macrosteles quadrilineatus]|uniref:kinesin-like protein KIF19 n=1 Tax=Macrosteles quadrilineatus TaxID=74068 RepID=UPI0023E0CD4F|nr:kinesin-like protein KIF19 [Macrosteles quadrilineatus]
MDRDRDISSSNYASSSSSDHLEEDNNKNNVTDEKLMVAVRIRPLRDAEGDRCIHCVDDKTILVEDVDTDKGDILRQKRGSERKYVFDLAFGEDSTQEQVYSATTRGLVRDVISGYNATVFAYGATGAGKTHTMVGSDQEPGIMVRALNDIFRSIDKHGQNYTVSLSYLEIYNENIRDLLNPSSGHLELREESSSRNRGRGTAVAGLTEIVANSTQEVMELLQKGNKERTVEPTAANKTSSRSHALLSVIVRKSTPPQQTQYRTRLRQGRLYMLDLAGSERASQTKNRGKRLVEGAHINRSLLALGNVINSLSGGRGYVNYRDSKLTRLLREALSGNCRTVMVAHVSPAGLNREESRNTLTYASRASGISHNKVERNVLDVSFHVSQYRNIIQDLRSEITRLREKMSEDRPPSVTRPPSGGKQAKHLREQIVSTFRDQMKLRRRLMDIDGHLLSLGVEAERQHQIISQWESRSNKLYTRKSRPTTNQSEQTNNSNNSGTASMHQAWSDLSFIEREQERYMNLRSATLRELDQCRQRAVALENELPSRLDSETEQELLSLLCRVHELEADKMALQGERLVETHELRRRGELIQRFSRQQRITDDIITRQRQIMEEGKLVLPSDLQELYNVYQQEIHSMTYNPESLPPIHRESLYERSSRVGTAVENDYDLQTPTSNSTSGGDWDTLPPLRPKEPPVPPKAPELTSLPPLHP